MFRSKTSRPVLKSLEQREANSGCLGSKLSRQHVKGAASTGDASSARQNALECHSASTHPSGGPPHSGGS